MLNTAKPAVVADFIKSPFAGVERAVAKKDAFLSVALSANAGRVVVREWLRVPLDVAFDHLKRWFEHLDIAPLGDAKADDGEKAGPYSLFRLAAALVRESGELERMSEAVAALYRAAWEATSPPLRLLEPLLAEFRSALVSDSPKKPRYPFGQSRFALLKLILKRHAQVGGFMPAPHLCETDDAAYNLGRLLCLLAALQDAAHEYELEGPGVVERYYGTASAAPANVFGVLWKLHVHHLRKLEQQGEKGTRAATAIRGRLADIISSFPPAGPNQPPRFPPTLTLEEQGRFALGFYQQMASDRQAIRDAKAKQTTTK
jgi:CRISPR-associated protein Csd1